MTTHTTATATAATPATEPVPSGAATPPRVLFVLEYYPPHVGGVETLFATLTRALAAAGHAVTVVTLRLPGTPARETVGGVEIVRVRVPPVAVRYLFTLFALPAAWRAAAHADIVHTTTYNAAIPAWLVAALRRLPCVITVHEVFGAQWHALPGLNRWLGGGFRAYEWAILHLPFTRYLCVSRFTRDRLVRLLGGRGGRTAVVYNAIEEDFWLAPHASRDLHTEFGLPPGAFVALYFGRTGISKGVEYLIDAAVRVRAALPDSRLVLLLAKDPHDQYVRLMRRIAERDLRDYVIIRDPVPRAELPGYLRGAGCVVVPSVSEGFGYAAVEAATLGCTVIATSGHAVEEVIGGSVTLVPPQDAAALAGAIIAVARECPALPPPPRFTAAAFVAGVQGVYDAVGGRRSAVGRKPGGTYLPALRSAIGRRKLAITNSLPTADYRANAMTLHVGVNALFLALGAVGGQETYLRALLRELPALGPDVTYTVFTPPNAAGSWLDVAGATGAGGAAVREVVCPLPKVADKRARWAARLAYEYGVLPGQVRRAGCDVLFSPGFLGPARRGYAHVVTIHDMQHADLPENFAAAERVPFLALLGRAARTAAHILAVSDHAKGRIVARYDIPPERITVTQHAASSRFFAPVSEAARAAVRERLGVRGPYLLSVATLHAHKNLEALIAAYATLRQVDGRDVQLVLAGGRGTAADTLAARVRAAGLEGAVLLPGYVPDADLPALYAGAAAFVLPSRYEGFGIPLLEAMACGTPVLATTAAALPEVAGDAALLFAPDDRPALVAALRHLLDDPALRASLVARGHARARQFSWHNTAERTLAAFRTAHAAHAAQGELPCA